MAWMTIPIASLIITAASAAYQIYKGYQAKKAAKRAEKERKAVEEARKGFEIVVEGTSTILPVVYGKAKIGGARVFHAVSSDFYKPDTENADKILSTFGYFEAGQSTAGADYSVWSELEPLTTIKNLILKELPPEQCSSILSCDTYYGNFWGWFNRNPAIYPSTSAPLLLNYEHVDKSGVIYIKVQLVDEPIGSAGEAYNGRFNLGWLTTNYPATATALGAHEESGFIYVKASRIYESTHFNGNILGTKNEILYFQQALCQGPIEAVRDVIVNDSQYLDDPSFGEELKEGEPDKKGKPKREIKDGSIRIDCHYGNSPVASAAMVRNFPERSTAVFNNIAYVSAFVRLDRDFPQFSAVPNMQFLISGKKVPRVNSSGVLVKSGGELVRTYSWNPAWCLLDYLLDDILGKGLSESELDLMSFYNASLVCETLVQPDTPVGGKLYFPTAGTPPLGEGVTTRNLYLYECNLVLSSEATVRENIEEILSTMGDARLVWSQGKYKLLLQYPLSNSQIQLATTLTDDDLVLDGDINITYPSIDNRFNHCIIKYANECDNFNEAVASWPPKVNSDFWFGLGGVRYPLVDGHNSDTECGRFLNDYGVWNVSSLVDGGTRTKATMTWKARVPFSGTWTFKFTAANTFHFYVNGAIHTQQVPGCNPKEVGDPSGIIITTITLNTGVEYAFLVDSWIGENELLKGFAGMLYSGTDSNKIVAWRSTDPSYDGGFIHRVVTDDVYTIMLEEDSGVELETELNAPGIVDYYHALAKAEEIVRTSRSAASYKFTCKLTNKYLEPGDFIKLESKALGLTPDDPNVADTTELFLRVSEIEINEDYTYNVVADRFDYSQLAWAVDDDEYIYPPPTWNKEFPAPAWLIFEKLEDFAQNTVGNLSWAKLTNDQLAGYELYVNINMAVDSSNDMIFNKFADAHALQTTISVPYISGETLLYAIRAVSKSGKYSAYTLAKDGSSSPGIALKPPKPLNLVATKTSSVQNNKDVNLTWVIPATREDSSQYNDHMEVDIYRASSQDGINFGEYTALKTVSGPVLTADDTDNSKLCGYTYKYIIQFQSKRDVLSDFSEPSNPVSMTNCNEPTPGTPGAPTGFTLRGNSFWWFDIGHDVLLSEIYEVGTGLFGVWHNPATQPPPTESDENDADDVPRLTWVGISQTKFEHPDFVTGTVGKFWLKHYFRTVNNDIIWGPRTDKLTATIPRIEDEIEDIWDQLEDTQLWGDLITAIDQLPELIDVTGLIDDAIAREKFERVNFDDILSNEITLERFERIDFDSILQGELAAVRTYADTILSDTQSLAYQVTELASSFNDNLAGISIRLETISAENMAMASQITILESNVGENTAVINEVKRTYATNTGMYAYVESQVGAFKDNYEARISWDFYEDKEDFASSVGSTITWVKDYIALTTTIAAPFVTSPVLQPPGQYPSAVETFHGEDYWLLQMKVMRKAGTGWAGIMRYTTSGGHGFSNLYQNIISDTTAVDQWVLLEWDMRALTSGGNDWITNIINGFSFQLGSTVDDVFHIDYFRVARASGSTDGAAVYNLSRASLDNAGALAISISTLSSTYGPWISVIQDISETYVTNDGARAIVNQGLAAAENYDVELFWNFDSTLETWTLVNATASAVNKFFTLTTTTGAFSAIRVSFPAADRFLGTEAWLIQARVKRKTGVGWVGRAYFATDTLAFSEARVKNIVDTTNITDYTILTWDMSTIPEWNPGTIHSIQLYFSNIAGDAFDIDWIRIARQSAYPAKAGIQKLSEVTVSNAGALATDITLLEAQYDGQLGVINNIQTTYATNTGVTASITEALMTSREFDVRLAWDFDSSVDGFTALNSGLVWNSDRTITVTPNAGNTGRIYSPSLSAADQFSGNEVWLVQARVMRLSGTGWQGRVSYKTTTRSTEDWTYREVISDSTVLNKWINLEWDMRLLTNPLNSTEWTNGTITQIILELGATSADVFKYEYVRVSRNSATPSKSAIYKLEQSTTSNAGTQAISINQLTTQYGSMSAAIFNIQTTYATNAGVGALVQTTMGAAIEYDTLRVWNLDTGTGGFTLTNASSSNTNGVIRLTTSSTAFSAIYVNFAAEDYFSGSSAWLIQVRIKRITGSGWLGRAYFSNTSLPFSELRVTNIQDSTNTEDYVVLNWNMNALTGWLGGIITGIQISFSNISGDSFDIDWVRISRPSGSTNKAGIDELKQITVNNAGVQAISINSLQANYNTAAAKILNIETTYATNVGVAASIKTSVQSTLGGGGPDGNLLTDAGFKIGSFINGVDPWYKATFAGGSPTKFTVKHINPDTFISTSVRGLSIDKITTSSLAINEYFDLSSDFIPITYGDRFQQYVYFDTLQSNGRIYLYIQFLSGSSTKTSLGFRAVNFTGPMPGNVFYEAPIKWKKVWTYINPSEYAVPAIFSTAATYVRFFMRFQTTTAIGSGTSLNFRVAFPYFGKASKAEWPDGTGFQQTLETQLADWSAGGPPNTWAYIDAEKTTSITEGGKNVYAAYTVKVNANGHVAGYGLSVEVNDGVPVSNFIVNADRFAIGRTGTNGATADDYPFIVTDGVVYIKNAKIANAAITTAKIANAAITNALIETAAVTTLKVQQGSVTTLLYAETPSGSQSIAPNAYTASNPAIAPNLPLLSSGVVFNYVVHAGSGAAGPSTVRIQILRGVNVIYNQDSSIPTNFSQTTSGAYFDSSANSSGYTGNYFLRAQNVNTNGVTITIWSMKFTATGGRR